MLESMSQPPIATYRLQFRNGMTFDRAVGLIPHWRSLGISHLYASPIFAAVAGSTHGYDVTDPNAIEPALGGIEGFRRLSDALLSAGLGLILDIVPNHMAASLETPFWRSVVKWGRRSPHASVFDIDWNRKLTLPVLSGTLPDAIEARSIRLSLVREGRELVLDLHGSHYPLDPATYPLAFTDERRRPELARLARTATPDDTDALEQYLAVHFADAETQEILVSGVDPILALLDSQPWRMIDWRDAARELNYRRFFEITGLVGVRVEDPCVFDTTHRLILDLFAEGRIQGLRVDHVDGLADPASYLKRLRQAIGPDTYLLVEKILEGDERLPEDWPVDGTTGYEFIADVANLLAQPSPELDDGWKRVAPEFGEAMDELARAKRLMVDVNFEGEVNALIGQASAIAGNEDGARLSDDTIAEAVRALVAGFDVYRIYGTTDGLSARDRHVLGDLFDRLVVSSPDLRPAFSFLEKLVNVRHGEKSSAAAAAFRTRLQHLTGPVLAKSKEDTFFYRYNRLIALNEVGGETAVRVGAIERFHDRMRTRSRTQRLGLSTTATHDTKRGEDARARLYAISEASRHWIELVGRWRHGMADFVSMLPDGPAPEPATEWFLFQALAGMLPPDFDPYLASSRGGVADRFLTYLEKALREAKLRTNWTDVNQAYEQGVKDYAAAAIGSERFMEAFSRDILPFLRTGLANGLSQTLIKLTAPGVPDIYQGAEGLDTSLVDPDNRRVPDFGPLAVVDAEPDRRDPTATKVWLIRHTLGLRRQHAELFTHGDYDALATMGQRRDNIVAYARRYRNHSVIVVVPRLVHAAVSADALHSRDFWLDTAIVLPRDTGSLQDSFGGGDVPLSDGRVLVADIFRRRSVALLIKRP